jgi:hypothetical protein
MNESRSRDSRIFRYSGVGRVGGVVEDVFSRSAAAIAVDRLETDDLPEATVAPVEAQLRELRAST